MKRWEWISADDICLAHDEQIARYGGLPGIRTLGSVEMAAERPKNMAAYTDGADIARLSAAYAFGIARGHPFADGNKRTAWAVTRLFLLMNGRRLAEGDITEVDFAAWLRDRLD